jgi:DNA-binding MarR family transcriptional regulator
VPNWTTAAGRADAPNGALWLVSQVMWSNVMAHVPAEGIAVDELAARARTSTLSLVGLQRWRYVVVDDQVVSPTAAGRRAQDAWRPLADEVEARWRARFGPAAIDRLRASLGGLVERFEVVWPNYLPITFPTQNAKLELPPARAVAGGGGGTGSGTGTGTGSGTGTGAVDLSVLLSQVLLQFTLDFEEQSRLSLPISANTLRVLTPLGVPVRELPRLTGVSAEANSMAVGFLVRRECAVLEPLPAGGRGKRVRLTGKGQKAQEKYRRLLGATEEQWKARFGPDAVGRLRDALGLLVGTELTLRQSPLAEGLTPYPDGWRSRVRPPETLPHYPMVLHRGGYPDGT